MTDILKTDQYKLTMAEAGFPLREETFYYSHRKGGPHLLPVDVHDYIKNLFSNWHNEFYLKDYLKDKVCKISKLNVGGWFDYFANLEDPFNKLTIYTIPKGSWFYDRDPVFTVTGPSFLLSWLEPQILQLHYPIQIATSIAKSKDFNVNDINMLTCEDQKIIVEKTLEAVKELGYKVPKFDLHVRTDQYMENVDTKLRLLLNILDNDYNRIFEVGLRSATCMLQHLLALQQCKKVGILATSNTYGAYKLNMQAVGTMGHEHVQRFGNDKEAYYAMADRVPGSIFCLLDTHDTINSGIPAAYHLLDKQKDRDHAIRFDSGDIEKQLDVAYNIAKNKWKNKYWPKFCLEDGWNLEKTKKFEKLRKNKYKLAPDRFVYGFGGHIINCGWTSLTRDNVAAVWKLSQTGDNATMKFSNCGKESIPGKPYLLRLNEEYNNYPVPKTIIVQEDEYLQQLTDNYGYYYSAYEGPAITEMPTNQYKAANYSDKTKILKYKLENNIK